MLALNVLLPTLLLHAACLLLAGWSAAAWLQKAPAADALLWTLGHCPPHERVLELHSAQVSLLAEACMVAALSVWVGGLSPGHLQHTCKCISSSDPGLTPAIPGRPKSIVEAIVSFCCYLH